MSFCPPPAEFVGCSVQEQRERWERRRSRTFRELVQTEQDYCQNLHLVTTFFVEILKAKGTLRQDIRETIFSSIKDIHSVNQSLLVHLENGFLGKGLEQFCSHLHLYNTYVDNIYNGRTVLEIQLKKNKAFRRFKKLQEARPDFSRRTLEDLLQLPVQRIHQYKHFLQDLAAHSSPDDPEFQQVSRAVAAVTEVSHRIQDNRRRHDNELQLRRVQKLLKGRKTKVLASGRWFIREGWLKVVPQKGAEAKPKMFFLFSDVLLQAGRCSPLHPTHGDKFCGEHAFPLQDCTLEKVLGHTRSRGGLLSLIFPKDKLLLMSSDQQDLNDWQQKLTATIRKLQSRQTVLDHRDQLAHIPLQSNQDQNLPSSHLGRKRNLVSSEISQQAQNDSSAPKRMKEFDAPQQSSAEGWTSSCVLL